MDNAATKFHRHDITRIFEIGKYFEKTHGLEAVQEYIQHIHKTIPRYGKNDLTLKRYLGYHKEIQGLINR